MSAATGVITTIAGTGTPGYSGDGGPATSAQLAYVQGLAVDQAGNIYIADTGNGRIREVNAQTGIINTIAGNGGWGFAGDNGPAIDATFFYPVGVAVDSAGNVYTADENNSRIREIWAATGIITTVAGNGNTGYSGDGGPAVDAELNDPIGIAVDAVGDIYISDSDNYIRMVSAATGNISTVVGNGTAGYSGDGGPATSAEIDAPYGLAVDSWGNLYIADSGNYVIREVSASTQTISTVAGNGTSGYSGDGGPATSAELGVPRGIAVDGAGNLYIADYNNDLIRAVGSTQTGPIKTLPTITWAAPSPISYGTALSATQLDATASVAGTFTYSPAVGAAPTAGTDALSATFVPNDTTHYLAAQASVSLTVNQATPTVTWGTPSPITYGTALSAAQLNATASVAGTFVYSPAAGAIPPAGSQTLTATFTPNDSVDYSTTTATVSLAVSQATPTISWPALGTVPPGTTLSAAQLDATASTSGTFSYSPAAGTELQVGTQTLSVTFTPTDTTDYTIASASTTINVSMFAGSGIINTVAGTGWGYGGDGGPAIEAQLAGPSGIAVDAAGNIYFAQCEFGVVRKISASTGIITTFAGNGTQGYSGDGGPATNAELNYPQGVAVDGAGNLYIADTDNALVRRVDASTGTITTVAGGSTTWGYIGDGGPATQAGLWYPVGVGLDSSGNIYIADSGHNLVREVSAATGIITSVAGTGTSGYAGDGGPATSAQLNYPEAVAVDATGDVYVADSNNNAVREVAAANGNISTVAGNGTAGYSGDGGLAASSELDVPMSVAFDSAGDLYIADSQNNVIREVIASSGIITTVAGDGTQGLSGDGGPAVEAQLNIPQGIALDAEGDYYISDFSNDRIRTVGSSALPPVQVSVSPTTVTLYAGQTQQFSATVVNASNTTVLWSVSPSGAGTISSSGLYTAPATISAQQTVTIMATSNANPSVSAAATVTLSLPVAVTVNPAAATLYAGQTQQFSASLTNTTDTAVTWSSSPAGVGMIDASGLYVAPAQITAQQTVTVTAASQINPASTASAAITLEPACASTGYTNVRAIVFDHNRVADTDQTNFPVLIAGTYPYLATTANGGQLRNANGYDVRFTSDSAGYDALSYEIDSYNASTGTVAYWVLLPTLSHSTDTVIYMWYGNPNITASQENKSAVWTNGYAGVWHFGSGTTLSTADSTAFANNGINQGVTPTAGMIGGAGTFNGSGTSYIDIPASTSYKPATALTLEAWVNMAEPGSWPEIFSLDYAANGTWNFPFQSYALDFYDNALEPRLDLGLQANQVAVNGVSAVSPAAVPTGQWMHMVGTYDDTNLIVYVNGAAVATFAQSDPISYGTSRDLTIGTSSPYIVEDTIDAKIDEARVSTVARSAGWIATEYNDESSPSTFYAVESESSGTFAVPNSVTLYGGQIQQFSVTGSCGAPTVVWSMPAGSPGTLSAAGLYTAPANIDTQQTITLSASTLGASGQVYTSTVNLMPPISVSITPAGATLSSGQTQQFSASVTNTSNTAVNWMVNPSGTGTVSTSGLYQAPSVVAAPGSVTVTATSQQDPTESASATVSLVPNGSAPSISVSVSPSGATLYGGQTQQFTAAVINTDNPAVSWSISPAGTGSISPAGLYSAPATISTQQTVTVIATSQADTSQSGSSTITLAPTACAASGYAYVRQIVIDHTKIPNTDQANFPLLFSSTDPAFRTVENGGHVSNSNGYDLIFSEDPNGLTRLDDEIEEYNPATGQVVAWIRIPTLSHSADTVLYVFYGNPGITTSQQNPTGVWDSNFGGVWHMEANGTTLTVNDSTSNGNNATVSGTATAVAGVIGEGAALPGYPNYISAGSNPTVEPVHTGTMSLWVYYNGFNLWTTPMGNGNTFTNEGGVEFWNSSSGQVNFDVGATVGASTARAGNLSTDQWYYLTGTWDGTTVSLYEDGALVASAAQEQDPNPSYPLTFGVDGALSFDGDYLNGAIDEARISNIARSADWIAAEYNNQSSPGSFYTLYPENTDGVFPETVGLYASQSQQFVAPAVCGGGVTWSMPDGSPGTLTSTGLYTAPGSITTQQTVTITATGVGNPGQTATATVTLYPPETLSVAPGSVTLTANQTQQFTGVVGNSSNSEVTWTISPEGVGTLSPDGIYQAPSSITAQQTLTITATSVADTNLSATAMITLSPTSCASSGFGYQRVIVIDHTKVANTDQENFPFLFSTTNPDFANVANGGHVTSLNGYDIMFSTDPTGATRLDAEIEEYNPATGQLIAWIRIPTLSHSADTVLYMFYGNPAIATSQQNPSGVWDGYYTGVYHLANVTSPFLETSSTLADSTSNANTGTGAEVTAASGEIDGAAALDGTDSYIQIPQADFPSYPTGAYSDLGLAQTSSTTQFAASFGVWFRTSTSGGILVRTPGLFCTNIVVDTCTTYAPTVPGEIPYGAWDPMLYVNDTGRVSLEGGAVVSANAYNDNAWHFAVITYDNNGNDTLYIDGQNQGTAPGQIPVGNSSEYAYFVGTAYTELAAAGNWSWLYFSGDLDDISVSNVARSADWIQTEYNNQASPATFYTVSSPTSVAVVPAAINLYSTQTQQFAVTGTCDTAVNWTMPSGSPGSLSAGGLYAAPDGVSSQQAITITATSQTTGDALGSAVVTLLPPQAPIVLSAAAQSPYTVGTTQSFEATVQDAYGSPVRGVAVTFAVNGANSGLATVTTGANGVATYSYAGANTGNDTIVANAVVNESTATSNALLATWVAASPGNASGTVSLVLPPALGRGALTGAFTDNNGAVIEPLAIGAAPMEYVVPAGASQLQLGINDTYFPDNGGPGFVVSVNGVQKTVPPTAMPWSWTTETDPLNSNYQYGLDDGTAPVIAATGLIAGQTVTVAWQSGSVSTDDPSRPATIANGDQTEITGVTESEGAYAPTLYTTPKTYPMGQGIPIEALVLDGSGMPLTNVPVTLTVSGANPGSYETTTDSTGTAVFLYSGTYSGTDSLQAQATLSGDVSLTSGESNVLWTDFGTPASPVTVALTAQTYVNNEQAYYALVTSGVSPNTTPVANADIGFYVYGVDNFQGDATTDGSGHAPFGYYHTDPGTYNVVAVVTVGRSVSFSNVLNGTWPPGASGSSGGSNSISVSISGDTQVALPNTLQLTGTVTDNVGITPTVQWSQVSGPGTAAFSAPQQDVTTVSFTDPGTYVIQLTATDTGVSGSDLFTITVNPIPISASSQGAIGSPLNGSTVNGLVPITLAPGVTLQSGTLTYFPANNINDVTTLNSNTTSAQLGTLDTTMLANQSYWIQLQAIDTTGNPQNSLVLVTAAGNYKPGRVTAAVTDLVVPATGLSITLQRQYDSLNAETVGDFGYGWNLSTNVDLTVDPSGNVTFTLGGQRRTFYLTPQAPPCTIIGCLFPYYTAAYTPEPGFYGTLIDASEACPLDIIAPDGLLWLCYQGTGIYSPSAYQYTDATGTSYLISANGNLQSETDKNGNSLTITAGGITSSTGLSVPFVRDSQGRITQITDPQGNQYLYGYDTSGNLASVTYPNTSQPSTYTYAANHYYTGGTDFRNNPLPTTSYFGPTDQDPNGLPLNGRLENTTDALGETTSYAYNLATNTTTVTYPPDATSTRGTATMVYDSYGDLLSSTDPLGHTTTNVYDTNHNLTSTTDPLGHTTTNAYDQNGNKISTTYPATATSTNTTNTTTYNQYSEPTSTTDELGNVRTFAYDANYNPQSVTDSLGTLASFQFNPAGTMAAGAIGFDITQQPTMASQFSYDANGNLTGRTDALGRTTSYGYNNLGQKLTMTVPLPNSNTGSSAATTTYNYDQIGNITQTAAPLARTTSSTYDGNGNKLSDTDARGKVTTYTHDALNRLTLTTYPDSSTVSNTYDFRNNVIDSIDQDGHDTHNTYDLAGRLVSVTKAYGTPAASTTTYTYDNAGRKLTETDGVGATTAYTYDNAGNVLTVSGPGGAFQYAYDNARNRISVTDGNSHTTQYQYDSRKRLTQTTYPDSTTTVNNYDGPGNLANVTDQAGNQVQYTYDAANQLHTVAQLASPNSGNNTNTYGYDNDGNLITLSDENGHTTQNGYDLLSDLTSKILPDGSSTETRTYDNNGNLISVTHFNGVTTTYTYDNLNRLLSRATPGEVTVSHTYTSTGKYATTTDASGTTNYTYDAMDRLTSKATPEGTLTYTYDAAGHVLSIASSNTNGASVSYTYDSLNRLSTVVDNRLSTGGNTTTYTYDTANNLVTATYPNGAQSTFQYDQLNRLTSMTAGNSAYSYTLGPTGIRTGATELSGRTVSWSFDGIYRLTGETVTNDPSHENGSVAYGLDPVGNRQTETSSLTGVSSGTFSYNADDELTGELYDANGNVTDAGGKTFAYDSQNELVSMNNGAVTIKYDGFGNRVSKTADGATTTYLVEDDVNPTGYPQVFDELTNGAVTRTYTYGLQRIDEEQVIDSAWTPSFYGYDGFGTVRQLTSIAGAVTDSYEYDAFGNQITHTGTTPNNYLYRGEQYDSDLGLYYLRARYYNPLSGRFMSRDPEDPRLEDENGNPIDPHALHKYLYAGGDPVNLADPNGRELFEYVGQVWRDERAYVRTFVPLFVATLGCVGGIELEIYSILEHDSLGEVGGAILTLGSCYGLADLEFHLTTKLAQLLFP